MKRQVALLAIVAALPAGAALANPCGYAERGRIVITGYKVGQTAIPADQKARLAKFAQTAKFRDKICVFAQVDKQGSKAANERVADGRAHNVQRFLESQGVPADAITINRQKKAFTLFGLLPSNQPDDRRVYVTHN